jgi:class 3 adenylate cyclase/tetratricopeptide (TPR) repeat protein
MKCQKCQFDNPETIDFCGKCGAKFERICPSCNFVNPPEFRFCGKCGHQLEESVTRKIEPSVEEERKQVTVLFSDLSGYTAMSERLDPEEVKKIMSQIFGEITSAVSKYDGTIQKFIGDAVVAFFGVPKVHEDDPVRAIRTAREIHELVDDINPQFQSRVGKRLAMHTGINTGLVVTGEVTTGKGILGVTGDTVNVASRLSTLAKPGEILVGEDTYHQAEWLFNFEPLEPASVKGKAQPVQVYRIAGIKEKQGRSVGIDSPLVGREKEMDLLSLQILRLINGTGGIVTVTGEAGIGKSRLLAELRLTEVVKRTIFLEGRAVSMGRSLSFYPIIDALKHWSQIRENDTDTEAQRKLEKAIGNIHPEEAGEIFPFIATLMGMKLTGKYAQRVKGIEGESLEKLIFKNMRELLIKGSEVRPTVIYIEDFHWVDTSSMQLVEALFRLVEEYRILFILAFRLGYTDTGERINAFIQENYPFNWTKIDLEPLKESESEQLLSNLLQIKSFPHQLREQILQRAGGNPFFIEEVVRSLINEGAVVLEKGEYRVTEKIKNIVIPQSIHALIMARIDRLDEETRNLVRVASVIGRNFFYRILTEVASYIEEVDRRLDYLKEIQLIRERKRMEEVEYFFKHALTQEAAYESILIQRRKEVHQKVAQTIEKVFNERLHEFYGMLAYHYSMAESLEKAEEYLIKAGAEALRSSASAEALNYYQQGLKLYLKKYGKAADPEKLASFEKNIALAFFHKGQYENAVSYFDSVLERWGIGIPKKPIILRCRIVYDLLSVIANLYLPFGKSERIPSQRDNEIFDLSYKKTITLVHLDPQRCFSEFINTFKRINKFDITKIENGFGMWISASGLFSWTGISFRLSKKILDYAKTIINKNEIRQIFFCNLFELLYNCFIGNWRGVKEYDDDLVALNLKVGEYWHVSTYIVFYGYLAIERGAFSEAEAIIDKLSEIWETYGNENGIEYWYSLKIVLLILLRKFHDALKEADTGIAFQRQTGRELVVIYYLGYKAVIQIQLEDISGAKESLLQAQKLVLKIGFVPPIYISGYLKAQFLFDLHLLEQAIRSNDKKEKSEYIQAAKKSGKRALKNSVKYALDRTEILRMMGLYWWFIGGQTRAIRFWNHSIKVAERFGANVQLAKTYMEIGQRLSEKTSRFRKLNSISAEEYLKKAKSLFEKFGLESEFEKLDKLKTSR